uniref:Uncharacterized protein n=1 Tax=Opuntia streptacantha TaxID=393608 RepID=A0A7C8YBW0_OPUST
MALFLHDSQHRLNRPTRQDIVLFLTPLPPLHLRTEPRHHRKAVRPPAPHLLHLLPRHLHHHHHRPPLPHTQPPLSRHPWRQQLPQFLFPPRSSSSFQKFSEEFWGILPVVRRERK